MSESNIEEAVLRAAEAIAGADALLIAAGAGIGVDSGLPDFRGGEGFWRAYPPLARRNISFEEMADPEWFRRDPLLAWGFYGHRLNLYRQTEPHAGFAILKRWADAMPHGAFVFTSNVDGQFQKAGFADERISECHGSIHHLQCCAECKQAIWSAESEQVVVDEAELKALPPLPCCADCGSIARPNVLMFGDWYWLHNRAEEQDNRMVAWLGAVLDANARLVIVELGAGRAIATVRSFTERVASVVNATAIRINPRDAQGPNQMIRLPLGAKEGLQRIDAVLRA